MKSDYFVIRIFRVPDAINRIRYVLRRLYHMRHSVKYTATTLPFVFQSETHRRSIGTVHYLQNFERNLYINTIETVVFLSSICVRLRSIR